MTIENIDIQATIEKVQALIRDDEQMSATTKSMFEILIVVITLLVNNWNCGRSKIKVQNEIGRDCRCDLPDLY